MRLMCAAKLRRSSAASSLPHGLSLQRQLSIPKTSRHRFGHPRLKTDPGRWLWMADTKACTGPPQVLRDLSTLARLAGDRPETPGPSASVSGWAPSPPRPCLASGRRRRFGSMTPALTSRFGGCCAYCGAPPPPKVVEEHLGRVSYMPRRCRLTG
jgi:hypothetical protein